MVHKVIDPVSPEPEVKEKCQHHWVIESARGSISRGVCKLCGATKEFYNSWPYSPEGKKSEKGSVRETEGTPSSLGKEAEEEAAEEGKDKEATITKEKE